jgi:dolichol-phosphate mannosyltransferase
MRLTVVLPAYNEAQDLPALLNRIGTVLSAASYDFQVLVVNDGSTDATAEVTRQASAMWPITLIQHPHNLGLGAALRTGLHAATQEDGTVITMDADNSHDPALIPTMVEQVEQGYDVVIASRFQEGGQEVGVAPHRKLLSHAASTIMRLVFQYANVRDYSCGYRAYRASMLRQLQATYGPDFLQERGFACILELLLKLRALNARAIEIPLVLRYDLKKGRSKMRISRTIARYAAVMWHSLVPAPSRGR